MLSKEHVKNRKQSNKTRKWFENNKMNFDQINSSK